MSGSYFPPDSDGARWRGDCGGRGRGRRTARLLRLTMRTACEAAVVGRRGKASDARIREFHQRTAQRYAELFGDVKRLRGSGVKILSLIGVPCVQGDALGIWRACVQLGFVDPAAPVTPEQLFAYWRGALEMYCAEQPFTVTPECAARWVEQRLSPPPEQLPALRHWTLPPDHMMMTRVETAINAVFAQLRASNDWRAISGEYVEGAEPMTPLGRLDRDFFGD